MALEILAYVTHRPSAQDTFEGILEWWVMERYLERQRREVRGAVDELVAAGFLVAARGRDRRLRFKLNPERGEEARALVTRWEEGPERGPEDGPGDGPGAGA
jgi:hypothetical protein